MTHATLAPNQFIVTVKDAKESVVSQGATPAKFQITNPHTEGYDTVAFQLLRHILDALPNGVTYKNRLTDGLPDQPCDIRIIKTDVDGDHTYLCRWQPFDPTKYTESTMPAQGYLGTAKVISGPHKGIGFHAWAQNHYEFIYYEVI